MNCVRVDDSVLAASRRERLNIGSNRTSLRDATANVPLPAFATGGRN
ncbi:hypothetical protein [uncultured Nostoc sp.]